MKRTPIRGTDLIVLGACKAGRVYFLNRAGIAVDPKDDSKIDCALRSSSLGGDWTKEERCCEIAKIALRPQWLNWLVTRKLGVESEDLLELLKDPESVVREVAIEALAPLAGEPAVQEALLRALGDQEQHWFVRREAAGALAKLAVEPAVQEALLRALGDQQEHWLVRNAAAGALAPYVCEPAVQAALLRALGDQEQHWFVRREAAGALAPLAVEPAVQAALLRALGDQEQHWFVRREAAGALAPLAVEPAVKAALLRALEDPDAEVRKVAALALEPQGRDPRKPR